MNDATPLAAPTAALRETFPRVMVAIGAALIFSLFAQALPLVFPALAGTGQ